MEDLELSIEFHICAKMQDLCDKFARDLQSEVSINASKILSPNHVEKIIRDNRDRSVNKNMMSNESFGKLVRTTRAFCLVH